MLSILVFNMFGWVQAGEGNSPLWFDGGGRRPGDHDDKGRQNTSHHECQG